MLHSHVGKQAVPKLLTGTGSGELEERWLMSLCVREASQGGKSSSSVMTQGAASPEAVFPQRAVGKDKEGKWRHG